jgi:hypothetical protein
MIELFAPQLLKQTKTTFNLIRKTIGSKTLEEIIKKFNEVARLSKNKEEWYKNCISIDFKPDGIDISKIWGTKENFLKQVFWCYCFLLNYRAFDLKRREVRDMDLKVVEKSCDKCKAKLRISTVEIKGMADFVDIRCPKCGNNLGKVRHDEYFKPEIMVIENDELRHMQEGTE